MAAPRTIRLEDLIGSRVVAADGRTVGHVEEVRSIVVAPRQVLRDDR